MANELDDLPELLAAVPLTVGHDDLLWELRERFGYDLTRADVGTGVPSPHPDLRQLRERRRYSGVADRLGAEELVRAWFAWSA